MKTLPECKDKIAKKEGYRNWCVMEASSSVSYTCLLECLEAAAELYASQFREPSTEQSGGTEQEEDSTEFVLTNFLLWVEMETTYFEDKDVTPTQVVQAYLNTIHTRKPFNVTWKE